MAKKALGDTVKIKVGEKKVTFTRVACSNSPETAKKEADKIRATGYNARVMIDPATGRACAYKGAKTKPRGKR